MRQLNSEIAKCKDFIAALQGKLDGVPARNGITEDLFIYPTVDDLRKVKLITPHKDQHNRYFLSEKGQRIWTRSQDLLSVLRAKVIAKSEKIDEELALKYWNEMKALL